MDNKEVISQQPSSYTEEYVNTDIPRGLEYLSYVDKLYVNQQVELVEVVTGIETCNQYAILNSLAQNAYYAMEESDFCIRNLCGNLRSFTMLIMDNYGRQVMEMRRPLRFQFPFGLQCIDVMAPPGTLIGSVDQKWHLSPRFKVRNCAGDTMFLIHGPLIQCGLCCDIEFKVISATDKSKVGKITKKWSDELKEFLTDADLYGIEFPLDLDVNMKAVLLGACFLIDYMYYEESSTFFDRCNEKK